MDLKSLHVIQHRAIPPDEAWIIRNSEADELPPDLRGKVKVPCIVTGNMNLLKETLILLRLFNTETTDINLDFKPGSCRESRQRTREFRRHIKTIR